MISLNLCLKVFPFSAGFCMKTKEAPETLRLLNPPGFGSFTENKQGRHNLPQACGNAVGECLSPVVCFSPLH